MKQHRNTLMIQVVAEGLGDIKDLVAFVGGATTALYIDDMIAAVPTPSDDVDFVVEITSRHKYAELENLLRKKGFRDPLPDPDAPFPLCRKIYRDIQVDIMPTDSKILGFGNRWYADAMKHKESVTLPNGTEVYFFNVAYFLVTKLEAFNSRGKSNDIRFSQDLEDILAVLDGCSYVEEKLSAANSKVCDYVKAEFRELLKDEELLEEAASGFIRSPVRVRRVVERIRKLIK